MPPILANPSNIVVPLSMIIDQLQGKLTTVEIHALLAAVVSGQKQQVNPGDLITADLMNQILHDLADLNLRVATLEAGTTGGVKPVILDVSPQSLRVGETLTVSGSNFPSDPDLGKVSLDGMTISRFSVASDRQLVFTIPALARSLPADVTLTIGTGQLSDTATVHVLPALTQVTGRVVVTNKTQSLPTINVGQTYNVDFEIDSITNIAESYSLTPVYSALVGTATQSDWLTNTTLLDPNPPGNVSVSEVFVQPGTPQRVRVQFKVPAGATSANLQLQATSVSRPGEINLNQTSNPALNLNVGQPVTPSDPKTTFALKGYGPAVTNARLVTINAMSGVEIAFGQTQFVRVNASMTLKGTYDYSAVVTPDSTGWTIPSTDTSLSPANSVEQAGGGEEIGISVTSNGSTTPVRTLTIKAVRRADADGASITSWIDIPIRGF